MFGAMLPAGGGVNKLLMYSEFGVRTDRWFAGKVPPSTRLAAAHHYLNTHLIVLRGKCFGPGFPSPECIEIGEVLRILYCVSKQKESGKSCCICTAASNAAITS
jgi:hypothetical protein